MFFRSLSLSCLAFLAVVSFCSLSLSLSPVLVSAQLSQYLEPVVDRVSATTARVRFLNLPPAQQTYTLIQLTNNAGQFSNLPRPQFHACAIFASTNCFSWTSEDREYNITQVGSTPTTSYILRGLTPSTNYILRVASIDTQTPPQIQGGEAGAAPAFVFTTKALDASTTLDSLVASGGCGSLTSTGTLYYLRASSESNVQVYTCDVVSSTSNVSLSVVPTNAYSTIDSTPTSGYFSKTNQTLSVTALQVDPLPIYYNNTITLGATGTTTNVSFIVTSQSGVTKTYRLSIYRALPSTSSILRGPTSPVTAMIRSPPVPSNYSYRALLWSGTSVTDQSWKVWSDDLTVFPFSAFNITFPSRTGNNQIDYTLAQISVSPAASLPADASCSNIYVGLFDTSPQKYSTSITTCVTALDDYCSPTPAGVATKWQTFNNAAGIFTTDELYHPAPPTPGFPAA